MRGAMRAVRGLRGRGTKLSLVLSTCTCAALLAFTAPAGATKAIIGLSSRLQIPVTEIGRIESGTGVRVVDDSGRPIAVGATGFRHF